MVTAGTFYDLILHKYTKRCVYDHTANAWTINIGCVNATVRQIASSRETLCLIIKSGSSLSDKALNKWIRKYS
ncbi:hypothetical protein MAR_007898 [Mya arenaria]|uniref:Uncharacterized protein n=1 Tax=Mya arenaria TaxID=6604 RepID=A0ABY7DUE7_MYAAR|nr:hypothetical protein MAR_007898 [Mya arenaria]